MRAASVWIDGPIRTSARKNSKWRSPAQRVLKAGMARLMAELGKYTATEAPQCTELTCGDSRCPKPALHKNPEHGWYWSPWCVDDDGNDMGV